MLVKTKNRNEHITHQANVGHAVSRSTPFGDRSKWRSLRSYRLEMSSSQIDFWWNNDSDVNQFLQKTEQHNYKPSNIT